jgi:hypothetical protein
VNFSYSRRLPLQFILLGIFLGLATGRTAAQQIPSPEQYFGFQIGADRKLVRYDKIVEYMQKVAGMSDRVRVYTLGLTTNKNPLLLLEISSPETQKNLDHFKTLERELYLQGGTPTDSQRDQIFSDGKAVVFITNNIHSTEIGASQMSLEAVYRLATDNSPAIKKILDNDIILMMPSINPDGQIMVTDWYNKYIGTPQEGGPMPWIYHPYVGHDNNRDMFLFSQKESQLTAQALWHDWFPAIWLDEHQQGQTGPRIFTMPARDPINPNVDPLIYRLNSIYGQAQAAALESEGKEGIIFDANYTNFWEGAMAWAGWWHNEVGLLTEVASVRIATPTTQQKAEPTRATNESSRNSGQAGQAPGTNEFVIDKGPTAPLPAPTDINPRTEYPRPWMGGAWHLRDIVDYELTATFALLETAADRRETLLHNIYDVNLNTIALAEKGELGFGDEKKSFAALIPVAGQQDQNEVIQLVEKLNIAGVNVERAQKEFSQDGETYPSGTYVVPFDQVFGRYAKDILEKQTYPEVHRAPNAPAEAPYDVSAWSLGMQFGVKTVFARTALPHDLQLETVKTPQPLALEATSSAHGWSFPYTGAESAIVVNRLLKGGAKVNFSQPHGDQPTRVSTVASPEAWKEAISGFTVTSKSAPPSPERPGDAGIALRMPRIGLYQSWTANIDEGWTRWILEQYEFPHKILHNADIQAGDLRKNFDAIILPDQEEASILEGQSDRAIKAKQSTEFMVAEYRGGIGEKGWKSLMDFVNQGGTLISLGAASDLLIDKLPLPVIDLKKTYSREQHFAPGAILNIQVDTKNPIGFGMAPESYAFYINSPFFQVREGFNSQRVSVVARFPNDDVNASGWLRGEDYMKGQAAVISVEENPGKLVLFGIRPQHRGQTHATLPLLFNSLYWSVE